MKKLLDSRNVKADFNQMCAPFDRSKNGTIQARELSEILKTLGEVLTKDEQDGLCNLCSKGGSIKYTELFDKLNS